MPYGYRGRVLEFDLSTGSHKVVEYDDDFYRTYLGGRGIGAYYLLREPITDPLAPEALLTIAAGAIVGAPAPAVSRFSVVARSPLTGGYGEAEAGGFFGLELKRAGYDAIVLRGRAPQLSYLYVSDSRVELRPAPEMAGWDTGTVEEAIRGEYRDDLIRVAAIGMAGENQVRYACVIGDSKHAAGRTGMGAVMGSKNLKAVAVRGHTPPALSNPQGVSAFARWYAEQVPIQPLSKSLRDYGTAGGLLGLNASGILPTRNFRQGEYEHAEDLSGDAMNNRILTGRKGCFACPVQCKRVVKVDKPRLKVDERYGGPEYETLGSFGSVCGINDIEAVAKANELCNRYGIDTISAGVTIAFVMECFERGILTAADTGGFVAEFGDAAAMLQAVEMIARREGFGAAMAEGSKRLAEKIGRGAEKLAIQVKGQELPMHEGRGKTAIAMGYALAEKGADHQTVPHDTFFTNPGSATLATVKPLGINRAIGARDLSRDKVRLYYYTESLWSAFAGFGVCTFGYAPRGIGTLDQLIQLVRDVTGWDFSLWEFEKAGERLVNMIRVYNCLLGRTTADDVIPERLYQPLENGVLAGKSIDRAEFAEALRQTYEVKGWDPVTGMPKPEKLNELDLGWVADRLK